VCSSRARAQEVETRVCVSWARGEFGEIRLTLGRAVQSIGPLLMPVSPSFPLLMLLLRV
jgi:hypothetical protein